MLAYLFLFPFAVICFIYGLGISNPNEYSMKILWGRMRGRKQVVQFSHVES